MIAKRALTQVLVLAVLLAVTAEAKPKPKKNVSETQPPPAGTCTMSGTLPPATANYIYPRVPLQGFFQWQNMLGYCGEVSMISAAMNNGEWYSQYNSRLLCGTGWGNSGPPVTSSAYCTANHNNTDYNAQVLDEDPNVGVDGGTVYSWAHQCAQNARLADTRYPFIVGGQLVSQQMPASECFGSGASTACPGYQNFMSWLKQQTILGNEVSVAILDGGGSDNEYDHEVNITRIGTNHSVTDPTYYPDDVLYIEDHGGNSSGKSLATGEPSGSNGTGGCSVYEYGYTFAQWGATRVQANVKGHNEFYIIFPAPETIQEGTGESTGQGTVAIPGPNNFAESVTGPMDTYNETVPVVLTAGNNVGSVMSSSSYYSSAFHTNLPDLSPTPVNGLAVVGGLDWEVPDAGTCTNNPPTWMENFGLQATVSGLTSGVAYNLYEYQFNSPASGVNTLGGNGTWAGASQAALAVPITAFNANSAPGSSTPYSTLTTFTASGSTYVPSPLVTTSDQIVVYRAVQADPGLYSPVNGSTLAGGIQSFAWDTTTVSTAPDYQASAYWLDVGSTQGGNNYYQSGSLSNTTFTETVNSLPSDGSTVWARWHYLQNGQWLYNDYSYTASNGTNPLGSILVTPAPSSTLTGSSATFFWTAGTGVTGNALDVGSTQGGNNYYQSGILSSAQGNSTSLLVNGLPTNGSIVYVTMWSQVGGQWQRNEYTYTALNAAAAAGVMQTPANGATLSGSSQTFTWAAGSGATAYWLDVGSSPDAHNYSQSGNLGNVLTTTVNGLPEDGSEIFATLYSMIAGQWTSNAYTYYAYNLSGATLAVMQTPVPNSAITGNSATFTWSAGNGTAYWVDISAVGPGQNDVYQSGNLGDVLTTTVNSLPGNNGTLYVTLYTMVGGQWESNAYTYTNP